MNTAPLTKKSIYLGLAHSFRGLVHCHHKEKHGSMHAVMVMEREMRRLHTGLQAAGTVSN